MFSISLLTLLHLYFLLIPPSCSRPFSQKNTQFAKPFAKDGPLRPSDPEPHSERSQFRPPLPFWRSIPEGVRGLAALCHDMCNDNVFNYMDSWMALQVKQMSHRFFLEWFSLAGFELTVFRLEAQIMVVLMDCFFCVFHPEMRDFYRYNGIF